jgi:hypothetical protein
MYDHVSAGSRSRLDAKHPTSRRRQLILGLVIANLRHCSPQANRNDLGPWGATGRGQENAYHAWKDKRPCGLV